MSFTDCLDRIKYDLDHGTALQSFITANFERNLQVRLAYKDREEINKAELPIILITRPEKVPKGLENTIGAFQDHTVVMYIGFHCNDHSQGQRLLIQFEEQVEAAIMRDMTLNGYAICVIPGPSRNDQGANHPEYFIVKTFTVSQEVLWQP